MPKLQGPCLQPGAAELEESALEPCSALPPRAVIQLNANCVRHALKRAGLLVNVAQPSSRSGPILVLWARHSHAWVIEYPTWPVEWKQISPFLGYQDFMWTGQPDLALAFAPQSMPL